MADPTHSTLTYSAVLQPYMPVFYVSFLVTLILTPLMRRLAHRHGVVDDPDNKRKVHTQPIAYLGGVSIFLGWIAGVTVAVFLKSHFANANSSTTVQIPPGILMGAMAVVLFGLMDDVYSLSPKMKLLGQFIAALFLMLPGMVPLPGATGTDFLLGQDKGPGGMVIQTLVNMKVLSDSTLHAPWVGLAVPLFSGIVVVGIIVCTCNATNLLDGLDGLCSGVTGVMSVGYLILALSLALTGVQDPLLDPVRVTLALALLGAVLGFLPYNFNPASIFMGDTGSMFLGYMCGTMMLLFGQFRSFRWFLAAIIMFGLPMMDTLLAIVRRKLNGKPIFSPDSNHFHHFLIRRGFTVRRAVLLSYGVAALFVSFGLVIMFVQTRLALGIYLVLFGWIIVAAFKMGMIFQQSPTMTANTSLNLSVITPSEKKREE
ncbi:MAG TPA: MraY family glycosyltransferase, partial [Phycisphaerae bacterium]|nr:MraY family glycosyltransferase [Phycisphaerae bacterium]